MHYIYIHSSFTNHMKTVGNRTALFGQTIPALFYFIINIYEISNILQS